MFKQMGLISRYKDISGYKTVKFSLYSRFQSKQFLLHHIQLEEYENYRKGQPIRPPKFKRRMSKQTGRFTKGGFKVGQLIAF